MSKDNNRRSGTLNDNKPRRSTTPMGLKAVASVVPDISKTVASRSGLNNKVSIQRIYASWVDIVGADFCLKTIPVRLSWRAGQKSKGGYGKKPKEQKDKDKEKKVPAIATLHIASASAVATQLMYQEQILLERLNRVLGYSAIKHIQIHHETGLDIKLSKSGLFKPRLSKQQKGELDSILEHIHDNDIKAHLYSLGESIFLSQ
jgi:hypothetical protein